MDIEVPARGMRFGALSWGAEDPNRPLALLIHGYPDTAHTWRYLGPRLAGEGYRVVAPFTRGYGPSSLAPDDSYRVSDQGEDVLALRDALGGDERSVLVGHDWGAVALWWVTSTEPAAFSEFVAMSVPPPGAIAGPVRKVRGMPTAVRQLRMSWYFLFNQLPGTERSLNWMIPKLWREWSPGYDASWDLPRVFAALDSRARRRAALRYYRNTLTTGIGELFQIEPEVPVLYLHGTTDGCAQVKLGRDYAGELPEGSRFTAVPGVGHFLQLEDPEVVNELIVGWLGRPG